jgi:hypothetical protein
MKTFKKYFAFVLAVLLTYGPMFWLIDTPNLNLVDNVRMYGLGWWVYLPFLLVFFVGFGAILIPYWLGKVRQEFTFLGGIVKVLGEALSMTVAYVLASMVASNLVQYDDFYRLYLLFLFFDATAIACCKLEKGLAIILDKIAALVGFGISSLALASSGFFKNKSGDS